MTAVFELKMCRGQSLPVDAVRTHQLFALTDAESEVGVYHKIADQTIGMHGGTGFGYTLPKPFDCLFVSNAVGWLAVMKYVKGQRKNERETVFIPIRRWWRELCERKAESIKWDRMKEIGTVLKLEEQIWAT